MYEIRDATGLLVARHVRVDTPSGKRVTWTMPDGTPGLGGGSTADLPLYGTERLGEWPADYEPVLLVEGEKSADALLAAGFRALATVTGSSSAPRLHPLSELTGRRIYLWPDNDVVGHRHMARVAMRLWALRIRTWLIDWVTAPPKGDAADLLAVAGPAEVRSLIERATPIDRRWLPAWRRRIAAIEAT